VGAWAVCRLMGLAIAKVGLFWPGLATRLDQEIGRAFMKFLNGPNVWLGVAALVAVVLSAGVGLFVQSETFRKSRGAGQGDRRARGRAAARALTDKVRQIHADLASLQSTLDEAFDGARQAGKGDGEAWQVVQPLDGRFQTMAIAADELSIARQVGGEALVNQLSRLVAIHSGAMQGADDYTRRRAALIGSLPSASRGSAGAMTLTRDEALAARSEMLELNDLVEALRRHLPQDAASAAAVLTHLEWAG
jgi:hypothetical protein